MARYKDTKISTENDAVESNDEVSTENKVEKTVENPELVLEESKPEEQSSEDGENK